MGNRKDKPLQMRLLSSLAAFMLIGSLIYIVFSGLNFYVGALLAAGVLGLGIPSVAAGDSVIEMVAGFFEALIDGIMEVVSGIFDAICSMFG